MEGQRDKVAKHKAKNPSSNSSFSFLSFVPMCLCTFVPASVVKKLNSVSIEGEGFISGSHCRQLEAWSKRRTTH